MTGATGNNEARAALVERCKKGDNEAFRELYQLYSKAMFSISMRLLNDREEAEDVLQESFISAFGNIGQFESRSTFGNWLKRIVINRCLDSIRKRDLSMTSLDDLEQAEDEIPDDEGADYDLATIKKAIQQLPDGFRIILTLYLFEDYTHRMIAEKLGISEGTSKSQYSRARKKLSTLITQKAGDHER